MPESIWPVPLQGSIEAKYELSKRRKLYVTNRTCSSRLINSTDPRSLHVKIEIEGIETHPNDTLDGRTEKPAEHKAVTNSEDTTTKYHEALSVYRLFCGKPEKYEGLRSYHIFYKATMISGINSGASWVIRPNVQLKITTKNRIDMGCYTAVLCVQLPKNLEEGSLLRVGWSSHYQWPFKYEYALSKDDLQKSMAKDPSGFVRIRLPHQVIVNVNTKKLFLDVSADRDKSIRFCSVELHNSLATLNPADFVVYWPSPPHKSFSVLHPLTENGPPRHVAVLHYAVSSSGRFMVTLSKSNGSHHVDVWDTESHVKRELGIRTPLKVATKSLALLDGPHRVSVSSDGSQITLFSSGDELELLYRLYISDVLRSPAAIANELAVFKEWTENHCPGFLKFQGFGSFIHSGDKERFITCNGFRVTLYSTAGVWSQLYSVKLLHGDPPINISDLKVSSSAEFPVLSANGKWFLWHDIERIFVWHLEQGSIMSMLSWKPTIEECIFLASDDDCIALKINGQLVLLEATTGSVLQTVTVPVRPNRESLSISMQWMLPNEIDSLHQLLSVGLNPSCLEKAGCLVPHYNGITANFKAHHSRLAGYPFITHSHGATIDIYRNDGVALQWNGARLLGLGTCSDNCDKNQDCVPGYNTNNGNSERLWKKISKKGKGFKDLNQLLRGYGHVFLLDKSLQAVTYSSGYISVWDLKQEDGEIALLLHLRIISDAAKDKELREDAAISLKTCSHQNRLTLTFGSTDVKMYITLSDLHDRDSLNDFFGGIEDILATLMEQKDDIKYVNDVYDKDEFCSLARTYLGVHVNSTFSVKSKSVMSILCTLICKSTGQTSSKYRTLLVDLLESKDFRWIPRSNYPPGSNPLNILLLGESKNSSDMGATKLFSWAFGPNHTASQPGHHPEYMYFALQCMPEMIQLHTALARRVAHSFAYLSVPSRRFIIHNHEVIYPPSISRLWGAQERQSYENRNPIWQFLLNTKRPDPNAELEESKNVSFTKLICVAPFSLLWSVQTTDDHNHGFVKTRVPPMAWWKVLLHLVIHQVQPSSHIYIRPHYYKLDMLDNPAIEALIQYKWNKFAYALWSARFMIQCCYYLLIVIAAFAQIYSNNPDSLFYVFFAITALSAWLLTLEILSWRVLKRARKCPEYEIIKPENLKPENMKPEFIRPKELSYFRSLYNYLDLLAFLFPLATSMNQMMNISRQDPGGATWDLSFSIIIIFLHMISELRVFPGICRYVTIIIRAFVEIRVFFMVFAFGILTFALAIQHVLRGCASKGNGDGNGCSKGSATAFPKDFWEAITSTYLIMGGRYDPVSKELSDTPNAPLQAMVVIYFFFTVILMLNVLIALINGGFDLGSSHWRLVWLENRLRYVESAEEMSYHVPGFRESRDWFPREIYYVATKVDSDNYASQIKESKEVEDILEGRMHESDEKMMEMGGEMDDNFTKLSDEISEVTSEILGLSEVVALIQRSLTERKDSTRVGDDHSEEEDENAKGHGNIMEASEPTKTSGEEKSGLFNNEVSAVWDGGNEENSMSGVIKKGVLKSVDRSSSTTQQTYQQQDGSNGNSARAEDQYDQKALLQLRAQVDDLIKKQDETYQHNVRLEEMLARVVKKLGD